MQDKAHPDYKPPRRNSGCGLIFFAIMLVAGSLWGAALGVFVKTLDDAKHTIDALEDFRPKIGSKVYSADGVMLGEFAIEQRQTLPLHEIPLHVQMAFVGTEDDRFFQHKGVRIDAILNAVYQGIQGRGWRGASTITQQVVRNVESLQVGLERTLGRKIREAIVALQVERQFTKDEILELYLNQIFLGISAYGVEAAARQYYGKSIRDVTLSEAAALAGLTRAPNANNPIRNIENARTRRDIVLAQMLENEFISPGEREAALAEDLTASVVTPEEREALQTEGDGSWKPSTFRAPYFVEEIRQEILASYGKERVFEDGMHIETTLDMRLQRIAESALLSALDAFDEKKRSYLEARGREDEFIPVSGGLICLDNRPEFRGYVRAMVGGRDFEKEKYNTVTQALRQPGSSVKPFVWTAAIDSGMTPSTVVLDTPYSRIAPNGKLWAPKNFDGKFNGPMAIRHALEKSVNVVSIRLVEQLGMPVVRSYLQSCGITTPIDSSVGLTIALGSPVVKVIDHAVAYSCFPNGGVRHDPVLIRRIRNRDGITRYDAATHQTQEQAIEPDVAYVVLHMLQGVCEPGPGFYPTGWRTHEIERPRGGKTGTTNSSRDVWFCGFTADYTCIVWVGYRDNRPLGSGRDYTGGRLACPIWVEFMKGAHEGMPPREFEVPYGVDFYNIDRKHGTLGGSYREAYLAGTRPPEYWAGDLMTEGEPEGEGALENGALPPARPGIPSIDDTEEALLEAL